MTMRMAAGWFLAAAVLLLPGCAGNAPRPAPVSGAIDASESLPTLAMGAGTFKVTTSGDGEREIEVFHYRPRSLREDSPVLFVMAGAGRNADDYRDHWIDAAERHGVLVLAPHYPEDRYPRFWNYNLARMIDDVVIDPVAREIASYRMVADRDHWLFRDIERIFDAAVRAAGLKAARYDMFGHSAGGQFLHRYAMFADEGIRAGRILAANSGWYTVPERGVRFPYGLDGAPIDEPQLAAAFSRRLVVFLGGKDDASETRGELVRSADTDRQGLHRLERGQHFHAQAAKTAASIGTTFNWTLHVVPGVGHDAKQMGAAAATFLYGGTRARLELDGTEIP